MIDQKCQKKEHREWGKLSSLIDTIENKIRNNPAGLIKLQMSEFSAVLKILRATTDHAEEGRPAWIAAWCRRAS
jgi:hypothetical protein